MVVSSIAAGNTADEIIRMGLGYLNRNDFPYNSCSLIDQNMPICLRGHCRGPAAQQELCLRAESLHQHRYAFSDKLSIEFSANFCLNFHKLLNPPLRYVLWYGIFEPCSGGTFLRAEGKGTETIELCLSDKIAEFSELLFSLSWKANQEGCPEGNLS